MAASEQKKNRTVTRTLEILSYISKKSEACSIAELYKELGIPKTSVFDIVHTLELEGALEFNEHTKGFSLGVRMLEIGMAYMAKQDVHTIVRPYLKQLSVQFGETAYFAIPSGSQILYIDKIEGASPLRTSCAIGERNALYRTGLGKAMLAVRQDDEVIRLLDGVPFVRKTPNTIVSIEELLNELQRIRARGYSIDNEEDNENLFCIAVPVRNRLRECVGAISISVIKRKELDEKLDGIIGAVTKAGIEISCKMGFDCADLMKIV
ncbi:IclR family transcriptional regulator [Faecalicatena contorta]|uniref:IclR family transcriptional regulator n=1 Tax=Faecalicatena contorta TaxID=39482 RepID=UPI0031D80DC0